MNILIFGASGKTGQHLVRQALHLGHRVSVYVRTPSKLAITHPDLKVIQGELTDPQAIRIAIKGHETVLSTLGHSSPFKYDPVVSRGIQNIVHGMEAESVKRFIYMSVAGIHENREGVGFVIKHLAPRLLGTEIAGHTERENIIRKSALDWIVIHPTTLTNGPHTGVYKSGEHVASKGFVVTISRADVADFILKQLSDNQYLRKAPRVMY